MLSYYLRLAAISIRANFVLSALMIAAIALGIGTCMTIVTVNYIMGNDPIPQKSDQLFHVQLDNWDPNRAYNEPNEPPEQLTYIDITALKAAGVAYRQTANTRAALVLIADDANVKPFEVSARANSADFFAMFDVPFLFGAPWTAEQDDSLAQVVVLSRETNERVFGGEDSVGQDITLGADRFVVIGVLDTWKPMPRFYDVTNGPFNLPSAVFIPFNLHAALKMTPAGNTNCWKPRDGDGWEAFLASECVWTQFWVELRTPSERAEYMAFLDSYVIDQKTLGRFPRPLNNRLSNVRQWLANQEVVQDEARIMLAVAVMFLAVCLLNTIGLLLSKFLSKAPEIGLRRALGASKRTLFAQYMIEAGAIGLLGGLLGLGFTWLGLQGIRALFGEFVENLVQLDWLMVVAAIVLAILASVLAGLYPTWRACNIEPASQLKAQ